MKKIICIIFTIVIVATASACSNKRQEPDEQQVKSICELATVECYYNNLAKKDLPAKKGFIHWFEVDRNYWIEYDGVAKIGVDMKNVSIKTNGNKVTVTLPRAKVLYIDYKYESLAEKKIVKNKDSWINPNKITDEEQIDAINKAQEKMEKNINSNSSLIDSAEKRAKKLIENYINNVGEISGEKYVIEWKVAK